MCSYHLTAMFGCGRQADVPAHHVAKSGQSRCVKWRALANTWWRQDMTGLWSGVPKPSVPACGSRVNRYTLTVCAVLGGVSISKAGTWPKCKQESLYHKVSGAGTPQVCKQMSLFRRAASLGFDRHVTRSAHATTFWGLGHSRCKQVYLRCHTMALDHRLTHTTTLQLWDMAVPDYGRRANEHACATAGIGQACRQVCICRHMRGHKAVMGHSKCTNRHTSRPNSASTRC